MTPARARDEAGRPRNPRLRDALGRPLGVGAPGYPPYDEPALPPTEALRLAQQLLDDGRPFTAHEVLEAVWKDTPGPERELWRGLAQLAVAVTHAARGNVAGSRTLFRRAAATLSPFEPQPPHDIAVAELRTWATARATGQGVDPCPRLTRTSGT